MVLSHQKYMHVALDEARRAGQLGEVPVGAVMADSDGNLLATACNRTIGLNDPTAHAEILALRAAAAQAGNYRLVGTTLYSTIEPCIMCLGALVHARVQTVVFGAPDPKWGAAGSLYNFGNDERLNHHIELVGGVMEAQCRLLIQNFFRKRRKIVAK